MKNFFNPNNFLWRGFARIADFFGLSICWLVCSIPLITICSASIALYDSVSRCIYGNDGFAYSRFFHTFKSELKRGILLTLFWGIIAFVLGVVYQILYQTAQADNSKALTAVSYYFALSVPVAIFCWVLAVESRFVYGFFSLHKTAAIFAFGYLPFTVAVVALALIAFELCVNMPFFLMVLPAVLAYLQAFFIERVFKKYMPKEEPDESDLEEDAT